MSRVLTLALFAWFLHAAQAALAVAFGLSSLPVVPAVVLVAYAALVEPPVVAAVSAAVLGLILDALSGSPLGLNMLACLLALLSGRLASGWVAAPRGLGAFLFTGTLAAGYHLFVVTLLYVFGIHPESFAIQGVLSEALWNGLFGVVVLPFTQWLLVSLHLEEREMTLAERLSRRGGR